MQQHEHVASARADVARLLGRRALTLLAVGAAAALVQSVVEPLLAVALQLVLLRAGLQPGARAPRLIHELSASTTTAILVLAAVGVTRAIAQFVGSQAGTSARTAIETRLRNAAAHTLLVDPRGSLTPATDLHTHVSETFPKAAMYWQHAVGFATLLLQASTLAIALAWLSPTHMLAALGVLAVLGVVVRTVGRRVEKISRTLPDKQRAVIAGFERVARHRVLVRVLGMENEERRSIDHAVRDYAGTLDRGHAWLHASSALGPLVAMGVIVGVVASGPGAWASGPLGMVAFLYLFVRLGQVMGNAASAVTMLSALRPHWRAARAWLAPSAQNALQVAEEDPIVATGPDRAVPLAPPRVEVVDIQVGYPGGPAVLDGARLDVAPGALVGVAGPSGCGKTTLLLAMVGLLSPRAGAVRIGGLAPAEYVMQRGRVGFVGSEAVIFAGSLRSNLAYGSRTAPTDAELSAALALAQAEELADPGRGGLDRAIGEDGRGLSAGQRQRLGLARALVRRPALLLLDEPTANVDAETEVGIARTLHALRGELTCFVVSHREALLAGCDAVYDVDARGLVRRPVPTGTDRAALRGEAPSRGAA